MHEVFGKRLRLPTNAVEADVLSSLQRIMVSFGSPPFAVLSSVEGYHKLVEIRILIKILSVNKRAVRENSPLSLLLGT